MASTTDSKVVVNTSTLTNIATAIRNKNGETTEYKPSEMAEKINSLFLTNTVRFIKDESLYQVDSVKSGGAIYAPTPEPTIEGYRFLGWGKTQTATTYTAFPYTPTADTKLYAIFQEGSSRLPSAYQEVEYLQSDGSAYLYSTDFGITSNNIVTIKFKVDKLIGSYGTGYQCIFGKNSYFQFAYYTSGWTVGNAGSTNNPPVLSQTYIGKIEQNCMFIDDLANSLSRTPNSSSNYIFWNGESSYAKGGIIYYINILDNTTSLYTHQLVPCYRKADDVAGMYDLITGTFYPNQGSADFIRGKNV